MNSLVYDVKEVKNTISWVVISEEQEAPMMFGMLKLSGVYNELTCK